MLGEFLLSWVVTPAVMLAVLTGLGLLVWRSGGGTLPGVYVLPLGFASTMLVASFATQLDATAELTPVALVLLALAGFVAGRHALQGWLRPHRERLWPLVAAAVPFGVMAAPVVLSGTASFTGYARIVDIAHQLQIGAHLASEGRTIPTLVDSSAEEVVGKTLTVGYPGGWQSALASFEPLTGTDAAWMYQPFLAITAAVIGLGVFALLEGLVPSRPLRALAGAISAQGNVLFAYGGTGGCKELAAAALIVLTAGLAFEPRTEDAPWRGLVPIGVVLAGCFSVLSLGVAPWLAVLVVAYAALLVARRPRGRLRLSPALAAGALAVAALSVPAVIAAGKLRELAESADGADATVFLDLGNLAGPMPVEAAAGVWLAADYRYTTTGGGAATTAFIMLVLALAGVAVAVSVRRRRWQVPALAAAGVVALAYFVERTGPWLELKAISISNPIALACAFAGAGALVAARERLGRFGAIAGWGLALGLAGGVLYGNALAYHEASVAPAERLHDLQRIGKRFAGIGPAFYPSHEEYAEYFLRESGGVAFVNVPATRAPQPRPDAARGRAESVRQQFGWEVDELDPAYLNGYELIVRRRGPGLSRPPSNWSLAERTRWHEVWRQTGRPADMLVHQPLDSFTGKRSAVCDGFLDAVSGVGGPAEIAYATRPLTVERSLQHTVHSVGWSPAHRGGIFLTVPGVAKGSLRIPAGGRWEAWVEGSFGRRFELRVDGRVLGTVKARRNYPAEFESFGVRRLAEGTHRFVFIRGGGNLEPGNGGVDTAGPMTFQRLEGDTGVVRRAPLERARELCAQPDLDWIEIVRPES